MDDQNEAHVLMFPLPLLGHVNSMLKLAELLSHGGISITFLLYRNIHTRLLQNTNIYSDFSNYSGFHFEILPEEMYEGGFRTVEDFSNYIKSLEFVAKPFLRTLLIRKKPRIESVVADGSLIAAFDDVSENLGVRVFSVWTMSTTAVWATFCIPQLIEAGDLPFTGNDMDVTVKNVKGMEQILRRRDLPSFCHVYDLNRLDFKLLNKTTQQTPRAHGLIFNTFDDLEGPILSHIRSRCPNVYTIGPVHALFKERLLSTKKSAEPSTSLWKEDRNCLEWLGKQPSKSVLYVSLGSIVTLTSDQLLEFWYGLVNSDSRFLWVIRPDSVNGTNGEENKPPKVLEEATKDRAYLVEWAPQEEVLGHPAVGGFLTHGGWNSTMECILEGVPMICWPSHIDQPITSRFVEKVWKFGLDMKGDCDRIVIEKMVRELMKDKDNEFRERVNEMSKLAKKAVKEDGSSFCNMERLIKDMQLIGSKETMGREYLYGHQP